MLQEWQAYARKLESQVTYLTDQVNRLEGDVIKWKAVAVHSKAQVRTLGDHISETTGRCLTDTIGQDEVDRRVNSNKQRAEVDAQATFDNTQIVK